jgi:hypothetical protein
MIFSNLVNAFIVFFFLVVGALQGANIRLIEVRLKKIEMQKLQKFSDILNKLKGQFNHIFLFVQRLTQS